MAHFSDRFVCHRINSFHTNVNVTCRLSITDLRSKILAISTAEYIIERKKYALLIREQFMYIC